LPVPGRISGKGKNMTGKQGSQEEFDKAWFDVLLPAPEHDYRIAPEQAPEHERIPCLSFDVFIDFVTNGKWQSTIKQSGTHLPIWQSVPWSEREHALHAAMHRVTSGKIFEDAQNALLDRREENTG
jgi:hypothetical protein